MNISRIRLACFLINTTIRWVRHIFAYSRNDQRMINLLNSVKDPKIIHYVMKGKPSDFCYLGIMREKWWFYRNLELSKLVQKFTIFDSMKIGAPKFATEALILLILLISKILKA